MHLQLPAALLLQLCALLQLLIAAAVQGAANICQQAECVCQPVDSLVNISCVFDRKKVLRLEKGTLPETALEVDLAGGYELKMESGALAGHRHLYRVQARGFQRLFLLKGALENVTSANFHVQLSNSSYLLLESGSLKTSGGGVSADISKVLKVVIQPTVFHSLLKLTIRDVPSLEPASKAFHTSIARDRPSTQILLERVRIETLETQVFPSALAELVLRDSEIVNVNSEAVDAIELRRLSVVNCSLSHVKSDAFSSKVIVAHFEIDSTTVGQLATRAISSGISTMIVSNSRIESIQEESFMPSAVAKFILVNNTFTRIHSHGFKLNGREGSDTSWKHLELENNTFDKLEASAFDGRYTPADSVTTSRAIFVFKGNYIGTTLTSSPVFNFGLNSEVNVTIDNNRFLEVCRCNTNKISGIFTGSDEVIEEMLYTSFCKTYPKWSSCFDTKYVLITNFTEKICGENISECAFQDNTNVVERGIITTLDSAFQNDEGFGVEGEKTLLRAIFGFVVLCICMIMLVSTAVWVCKHNYFTKGRVLFLMSTDSLFNLLSRVVERSTTNIARSESTHSVTIHEYAELQRQPKGTTDVEFESPLENKATQTLPEELTHELLQTLREKLDDPDNYSEARDMIEHLYDLIKVEESCNQNCTTTEIVIDFDELETDDTNHVYDEIKPKSKARQKGNKTLVSVGTRAPSPDKLLPLRAVYAEARRRSVLLNEYAEPRDRRPTLTATYEYAELPTNVAQSSNSNVAQSSKSNVAQNPMSNVAQSPMRNVAQNSKSNVAQTSKNSCAPEAALSALANRPLPEKPRDPGEGPSTKL